MQALRQLVYIAIKEWRLLYRNPHGLIVLFLMPAVFLLVMSFALKNTLTSAEVALPATGWLVEDASPQATQWSSEWMDRRGGRRFQTRPQLLSALAARTVDAGVVVRDDWIDPQGSPRASGIELWLSNGIHPAAAARLRTEIGYAVLQLQVRNGAAAAGPFAGILWGAAAGLDRFAAAPMNIRYVYEIESGRKLTAVQQSVPAWLIFGMFFVVIPLAGVLVQERRDGTLARIATFGVAPLTMLCGKLAAFMAVNWVQLMLMLLVGRWLVPWLGGDALYLDLDPGWFALVVFTTSAAAVAMALAIGAYARSFDHAAALGAGANVVLAAVAGIMVPRPIMPETLQRIAEWSPMGWALDGMQAVFLGAPTAAQVLPKALMLIAFAAACMLVSWRPLRRPEADG